MSRTVTFRFSNEWDARLFIEGVQWANDSALELDGEGPVDLEDPLSEYLAVFVDEDGSGDETRDYRRPHR